MSQNFIGTNAVTIAISILPLYPAGTVDHFADGSDVWTGGAVETADMVKTPDGHTYAWTKNAITERTLTIAPASPIAVILDAAVAAQQSYIGVGPEPFQVTVIVTHAHTGQVDTYTDGIIGSGELGMKVQQDRLGNKQYSFKFGTFTTTGPTA